MKKYYKYLFLLLFGFFLFMPKDTYAREKIELSSSNGSVLWSSDSIEPQVANTSGVQYIIYYFDLNLTTQSDYMLDNEFIYDVYGNNPTGVDLIYLLLNGNEIAFTHSFSRLTEQYVQPYYIHKYINHINFSSNYTGSIQVQLTYRLVRPVDIGSVGITNQNLIYEGSNAPDTNETINNATTNIITNNNINTDKIIESNKETQDKIDKTNQELEDLNENLTSEDSPDLDGLNNSVGWLPAGPVDSILNLPLSLFNNLTSVLSGSCQSANLTLPFVDKNIILPCISTLYEQIGIQSFLNWIGAIVSALILYNYFLKLYKWVDDTLTMRENTWNDWGGV